MTFRGPECLGKAMPNTCLIWEDITMKAVPDVNPLIMESDMRTLRDPNLKNPRITWKREMLVQNHFV